MGVILGILHRCPKVVDTFFLQEMIIIIQDRAHLFVPDISTTEYVNGTEQCINIIPLSVENVGQR